MNPRAVQDFYCDAYLDPSGTARSARIGRSLDNWTEFSVGSEMSEPLDGCYVTPTLPVELHRHGMGRQDFSDFESLDLERLNDDATREGVVCVPSVSLPHHLLDKFVAFMVRYDRLRGDGRLPHVAGVSLEGPLLSSFGGTPEQGSWAPTRAEWSKLASCGALGLQYAVLSPDAYLPRSCLADHMTAEQPDMGWIVATLLEHGVRPALGHFHRADPAGSARCIRAVLEVAEKCGNPPFSGTVLTDHVFNDMPRNFKHAWRTPEERTVRQAELEALQLDNWSMDNLDEVLGKVPAELLRAAHDGLATLCINFDGVHVDLEVCKRVVELVGAEAISAITDSTDVNAIGGQRLYRREGIDLWYQEGGIVAAGLSSLDQQMANMRFVGLSEDVIWTMVSLVPSKILGVRPLLDEEGAPRACSFVTRDGRRHLVGRYATS